MTRMLVGAWVAMLMMASSVSADVKKDQRDAFMSRVTEWGEPVRQRALRRQYEQEVDAAQQSRAFSGGGSVYPSDVDVRNSKMRTRQILDKHGKPTSVYRDGNYESRTYQNGDTRSTIRLRNGEITGSSTYESNR
jgi:opacity protein-like surface antigen